MGTTFVISLLPAHSNLREEPSIASKKAEGARRRGKVLVIDDEPMIVAVMKRILSSAHEVVATSNSRNALARLCTGERFDVIFCDLMMPQLTGMDLYAEVALIAPDQAARMVFLTGGAFTEAAQKFIGEVPNLCIEKPFNLNQVLDLANKRVNEGKAPV